MTRKTCESGLGLNIVDSEIIDCGAEGLEIGRGNCILIHLSYTSNRSELWTIRSQLFTLREIDTFRGS